MSGDGIHLNRFRGGACVLTPEGLEYGYNQRNLVSLQALQRLREILYLGTDSIGDGPRLEGNGTYAEPYVVPQLPFSHRANTAQAMESRFASYPGCDRGQDESGREIVYRFETAEAVRLRAIVLDSDGVDVDLHILQTPMASAGNPQAAADCVARDDFLVEGVLQPGAYTIVVDSFVSGGRPQEGEYDMVLLACDADDGDCSTSP